MFQVQELVRSPILRANLDYFYKSTQEYAIIANCNTIFNIDFRPIVERHIDLGCDITEIHQNGQSLDMYLVKTSLLIQLIKQDKKQAIRA